MKPLVAITGASSGIGAAAARAFSEAGHPLLLTARRVELMEEMGLPDAICRAHDVVDAEGYRRLVDEAETRYGPVDLLVNNAGFMVLEEFAALSPEDWRQQFEVNCIGLLNTTSAVLPAMIERGTGTIMNIGSTAGRTMYPNHTVYNGTKYAVHAMTEGLRREAAPANVRVILISPGFVLTDLLTGTRAETIKEGYHAYRDEIGGALDPREIARAMLFAYEQPQHLCIWEMVVTPTRQLV
ncbi:SDR family oxidoreductase [Micromonospora sp. NPDC049679]|uniref:SDR family oxidoreductase n=1 Tax=Micromonospora sp. NPDC049679 TaxID=3155920 RepID=UPI0033F1E99B